jgi:hypothetical protein
MRLAVFVNEADMTDSVHFDSLQITQNITDRVSQASLEFIVVGGGQSKYDSAQYDVNVYGVDVRELYEIRIQDRGTGEKKFAGTVRQVKPVRKKKGLVFIECECLDWTTYLDEAYIVQATFIGQTDRAIIQSLVATYAPQLTALTANIANLATLPSWEVKEKTLRQALDEIVEFTGGEWKIDWDKNLVYFLPTDFPAPFGLSSIPNSTAGLMGLTWNDATSTWVSTTQTWDETGSSSLSGSSSLLRWNDATQTWVDVTGTWDDPGYTSLPTFGIDAFTGYSKDAIRIINRCTVLGAVGPGGQRIKATYDDPISQGNYGVQSATIVDDQITVAYNASLRAQSVVDFNGFPRETINLRTLIDGLEVGQSLPIYHEDYFLNGAYIIRELRMRQLTRNLTEYQVIAGAREPDALKLLKQLEARTRRFTSSTTAVPADGTVTNASINGTLSASVIGSVNAGSIVGSINAGQIGSINAAVIAGLINAGQIGSINAAVINGAIISSQVADSLIDRLSMFAQPLRDIPNLASDPQLPDANYPEGSFYRRSSDNQFRKVSSGAWINTTETEAITGKLSFYSIGTIKAGQILGLIAAAQIGSINASSITGGIIASQISTVNASAIQGSITSTQIGSVAASTITGTITSSQIGSVSASTITGGITATQIGSINAATITIGLIGNSQINSVSASKLTAGTIDASVITVANLDAANITTGSFSASRIGAGTISASVTMTSPDLNITSGATTVRVNATDKVKVSDTSLNCFAQVLGSQVRIESTINSNRWAQIVNGAVQCSDIGGNRGDLNPTNISFNFTQVLTARRTGWGNQTGTATRTAWDTSTVTTTALAQAVKALLDDLKSHGIIGA